MDITTKLIKAALLASCFALSAQAMSQEASICVIKGAPAAEFKYTKLRAIKAAKGSYGGFTDVFPSFSKRAKAVGAEAVIYYNASQRFGFWPWRIVRPVLTGTAITWDKNNAKEFSCLEHGGFYL